MTVELECMYCAHRWEKTVYNKQSIEAEVCPRCGDSSLKVRDATTSKIDAYKGCPPFPPKKKEPPDWTFMGADHAFQGLDDQMDAIRLQLMQKLAMPPGDML